MSHGFQDIPGGHVLQPNSLATESFVPFPLLEFLSHYRSFRKKKTRAKICLRKDFILWFLLSR